MSCFATPTWRRASTAPRWRGAGRGRDVIPPRSARDRQGPRRRQHRPLRIRQSRRSRQRDPDRQLHPARRTRRRSELLRVRRRRPVRDLRGQRRRRQTRRDVSLSIYDQGEQPEHLPLQHRPHLLTRQPELEPAAVLHGDPVHQPRGDRHRRQPRLPAVQRRPSLDTSVRVTRAERGPEAQRLAWQGLRGPAPGRLLRRSGLDLRPGRSATIPEPAPDPDGGRGRRQRHQAPERALDRAAGSDLRLDPRRDEHLQRCRRPEGGHRRVDGGLPPQGADPRRGRRRPERPWVQVSRLGNPLFNEVIVPMSKKDQWNPVPPSADGGFLQYVQHPELARLLPVLYPGVFPNLAAASGSRDDLVAILLTGIPSGIIAGFQNFPGATTADMLRLNMAIAPSSHPSILGLVGGDAAGFPNGRRVADDVVAIELRAIAGVTYPLVNPAFTPDGAAGVIYDVEDPATNTPPVSYP